MFTNEKNLCILHGQVFVMSFPLSTLCSWLSQQLCLAKTFSINQLTQMYYMVYLLWYLVAFYTEASLTLANIYDPNRTAQHLQRLLEVQSYQVIQCFSFYVFAQNWTKFLYYFDRTVSVSEE